MPRYSAFGKSLVLLILAGGLVGLAFVVAKPRADRPVVAVRGFAQTGATRTRRSRAPAVWVHPGDSSKSRIIASDKGGGIELFDLEGRRTALVVSPDGGGSRGVDVRYGFPLGDLVVSAGQNRKLNFFTVDPDDVSLVYRSSLELPFQPLGVCVYHNPRSDGFFVFTFDRGGQVAQWKLRVVGERVVSNLYSRVDGRPVPVRTIHVGGKVSACVADDETGELFLAEQDSGVWVYRADPEDSAARHLVDMVGGPGHLGEIEGLAVHYGAGGRGFLIVADEQKGYVVYDRSAGHRWVGTFRVLGPSSRPIDRPAGLAFAPGPLGAHPGGLAVFAAEDSYVLLDLTELERDVHLSFASSVDPRRLGLSGVKQVEVDAETVAVEEFGDRADDMAIWVDPRDPGASRIIATDKLHGLVVYRLDGSVLQHVRDGHMNNVDLRPAFRFGERSSALVAASDRDSGAAFFYRVNAEHGAEGAGPFLSRVEAVSKPGSDALHFDLQGAYGLCLYQHGGQTYAFVDARDGRIEQWSVRGLDEDRVEIELVRVLKLDSQPEGCVADDEAGIVYVGEEARGVWRFEARPDGPAAGTLVDDVAAGRLVADVEGLALYRRGSEGYLIVSSQGNSTFVLYDRNTLVYVGTFSLVGNDELGLDGVTETDGIEVVAADLGPMFPRGLFVAQDDFNVGISYTRKNQNFKLVSWARIAGALGLEDD